MFGTLSAVTFWVFAHTLREPHGDDPQAAIPALQAKHFRGLLKTTWVMATAFWIGRALGETVATVLFAVVAFFALREFITLSPTHRGDHLSLVMAFFMVLPLQF